MSQTNPYDIAEFVRDRDIALLSLDKETILAYMRKHSIPLVTTSDEAFWRGVHKARTHIRNFPEVEKQKAITWLTLHNSTPDIGV